MSKKCKAKVDGKPQQFLGTIVHSHGNVHLFIDKEVASHITLAIMADIRAELANEMDVVTTEEIEHEQKTTDALQRGWSNSGD